MHLITKLCFSVLILCFCFHTGITEIFVATQNVSTPDVFESSSFGYVTTTASVPQNSTTPGAVVETVTEHIAVQRWKKSEAAAKKLVGAIYKQTLPLVLKAFENLDISSRCSSSLMRMMTGLKQMKSWAFLMVDSSGKIPNGLINGNINSLGDYDQCLSINLPGKFRGQYCNIDLAPPLPERRPFVPSFSEVPEFINISRPDSIISDFLKKATHYYRLNFRSAACVPSTCTKEDVQNIGNKIMEMSGIEFDIIVPNCETLQDKIVFNRSEIAVMAVLGFILFLGIAATVVDAYLRLSSRDENNDTGLALKFLLCFSFYTNTLKLLKPDTAQDSIKVFHGMKVITILWVIINHTYYYLNYQACSFLVNAEETGKLVAFQFVANGFLNVETFFFISAVLITYGVMKMKEKKVNVGLYIFRRIWRLTPAFMLVLSITIIIPHLGSGPVWKETVVDKLTEKCRVNWWTNLLFINNFIPSSEMCMQWLWYIPVDTHLYILSLLVVIPLKSNPRLAFAMNILMLVVGMMISAASHIYYDLTPTAIWAFNHPDDVNYYVDRGYFRTYLHVSTYCIGLAVGYFIATRPKKINIPLKINICLWITSFVAALTVLYGVYDWNQGNVPNMVVSTLYSITKCIVWSAALGWVTIACMTGNGGIVTDILSWQAFVPLGRLTYMTYLIHPIIQFVYTGSTRSLIRLGHRNLVYLYLANILMSFMCAYGLSLLFESPFMAMEKVMFCSPTPKNKSLNKSKKNNEDGHEINDNIIKSPKGSVDVENGIHTINIKQIEANG